MRAADGGAGRALGAGRAVRQVEDAPHDLVRASALKAEAGALKLRQHARVQPVEQAASGRVEAARPAARAKNSERDVAQQSLHS